MKLAYTAPASRVENRFGLERVLTGLPKFNCGLQPALHSDKFLLGQWKKENLNVSLMPVFSKTFGQLCPV